MPQRSTKSSGHQFKNSQREVEVEERIARQAGEIILKYFDMDQQVEQKADDSLVTVADKETNTLFGGDK